jgi:hypothetical protein
MRTGGLTERSGLVLADSNDDRGVVDAEDAAFERAEAFDDLDGIAWTNPRDSTDAAGAEWGRAWQLELER